MLSAFTNSRLGSMDHTASPNNAKGARLLQHCADSGINLPMGRRQ